MEQFINNKKYLLIFFLFILLLFIIIMYFILTNRQQVTPESLLQPSPTLIPQISTVNTNPTIINPTAAAPEQFTGARDVEFTETEAEQIDQERNLRRTSPYSAGTFTVTYNPSTDIFEVSLVEPKTNSLNDFEIWRKINYSNVSLERFTFN